MVEADGDGLNGLLMDCSPVHLADPSATSFSGPDGSTLSTVCVSADVVEGERAKEEGQAPESSMEVMMESKGEDGLNYFIIGRVAYSGGAVGVEDADLTNPRGAQLMACRQLIGYRVNLKSCLTRVTDSGIVELQLGENLPMEDRVVLADSKQVEEFLKPCTSRVDVILSPSHSPDGWYPYWEGRGKMAPQFRSQGIGYLRLGDDMSRFGTSFLSLDAGRTFLDPCDGAVSVCDMSSTTSSLTSASSRPSFHITGELKEMLMQQRREDPDGGGGAPAGGVAPAGGAEDGVISGNKAQAGSDLKYLLEQLGDEQQVKWSHRAQLLQQLQTCATADPALLPDVLR